MVSEQGFSFVEFFKIYLILPLMQLLYLLLGIMISTIVSRVSSPLPLSLGIGFGFYVIGLFSNVMQSNIIRLFSPFRYFDFNLVLISENYEAGYIILFLVLIILFLTTSYNIYIKKDMKMVL